jgi:hypothetical protein
MKAGTIVSYVFHQPFHFVGKKSNFDSLLWFGLCLPRPMITQIGFMFYWLYPAYMESGLLIYSL